MKRRRLGVLLHPTSLPGEQACGELGAQAFHFIDFLHDAGATVWQVLPLTPTHSDGSPYQSPSAHAGNPMLIDLQDLLDRGWLMADDFVHHQTLPARLRKQRLIARAWQGFKHQATPEEQAHLTAFVSQQDSWLEDYALYRCLKDEYEQEPWWRWPEALRRRDQAALEKARHGYGEHMDVVRFEQFLFFRQWMAVKDYANAKGIMMLGDLPIFVAHDAADVWAAQAFFQLDEDGMPVNVAGVPPDYFSVTGQRWGNPLYDWSRLQEDDYGWWRQRLHTQLSLFDWLRIDHFRGFEAYWEIPAAEKTAINGQWRPGPGADFFQALQREYGNDLPLVAEDLGYITEEVHALRRQFHLPGMKILQFAFDGSHDNPYLPHNHEQESVAFTGTHDNDTTLGWFSMLDKEQRLYVQRYFGETTESMPWLLIRAALASVANLAVIPMQDLLALDSRHRMNTPGTRQGNWSWRFDWEQVDEGLAARVKQLAILYGRE